MNLPEIAYKAAEIMSERGHCKHKLADSDGRVCFNGALQTILFGNPYGWGERITTEQYQAFMRVISVAEEILRERDWQSGPVHYNNDPHTSGEDVIMLLKETGKQLEEQC